ncbi:cytosine permease [Nakamurella flavida]|uniref:Cytosine permease n=1 Tax=Nakamurella flavida TaxID=363630 RepID=A0A938YMN1_9ACTN|nr:cytosine permease [Nakamurella flavida]MBM9478059.1 cytosine permease [Nakamurella flavida]MDP9778224.1 NCS1 family nucleobase:cation symporter-1 [Nakamurella flavida]
MTESTAATGKLEVNHIEVVPDSERHGRARDLFPVWFSSNLSLGNAIFGALAVAVGNGLLWALVAVVIGNLVGGAFMALHSVQGARLGVPQLIQSRGQFGFYGALLPVVLAAFLYLGFFVTTAVVSGQALSAAAPDLFSVNQGLVLLALVSLALALAGYRAIHLAAKWALWPLAVTLVVVTVAAIVGSGGMQVGDNTFSPGPFFTAVGLVATFLLTYAPYVSDYSRYLPADTSASAAFGWTFAGVFVSAIWANVLGVVLSLQFPDGDVFQSVRQLIGNDVLAVAVLLVTALAIAGNNALNLYGAMLNLITAVSSFVRLKPSFTVRVVMLLPTLVIGVLIGLRASDDFYAQLGVFLSVLMLTFVPWGTINLLDFYLVRRGVYDVQALFVPRGEYMHDPATWTVGGVNGKAMISFFVGVGGSLPFVANGAFVGSVAASWGGADLSWVPGILITGAVYLILSRIGVSSRPAPAAPVTAGTRR